MYYVKYIFMYCIYNCWFNNHKYLFYQKRRWFFRIKKTTHFHQVRLFNSNMNNTILMTSIATLKTESRLRSYILVMRRNKLSTYFHLKVFIIPLLTRDLIGQLIQVIYPSLVITCECGVVCRVWDLNPRPYVSHTHDRCFCNVYLYIYIISQHPKDTQVSSFLPLLCQDFHEKYSTSFVMQ